MAEKPTILLVNFGGPRNLLEIEPFLTELLTDQEVVRTRLPSFLHNYLFRKIARNRAKKIEVDYQLIGGKSPIFEITEAIGEYLRETKEQRVYTFHRYLPSTHEHTIQLIEEAPEKEIIVFPLFPQYSYATTGSIATFLKRKLSSSALQKLQWIQSYPTHLAFIAAWKETISSYLQQNNLTEHESFFLFSAHGIPRSFVKRGDPYETECSESYSSILKHFPHAEALLAYQSKFGPGKWLTPYTSEVCRNIRNWCKNRTNIIFIPLAFTSDHIETLFEVEHLYMPLIAAQGLQAFRCPAFNLSPIWLQSIECILQQE